MKITNSLAKYQNKLKNVKSLVCNLIIITEEYLKQIWNKSDMVLTSLDIYLEGLEIHHFLTAHNKIAVLNVLT